LLLPLAPLTACSATEDLRFGTGDAGGTYYSYGMELAQSIQADHKNMMFRISETAGSAANLRLIEEGYLQLAFTQSDMLWNATQKEGTSERTTGEGAEDATAATELSYAAVAGLYTESCQIVVPADSDIQTIDDLYGKRVSLGEEESGVLQNAKQILLAYGLNESVLQVQYLSFTDSAAAMKKDEIDAFFCTAGAPTPVVADLAQSTPIRLLPVDDEHAQRIMQQYGGYIRSTVPADTYPGQTDAVTTLGVKTVLVADNTLSADTVQAITESLFAHTAEIHPSTGETANTTFATTDIPIGFHKGAAQYYAEQGIAVTESAAKTERKKRISVGSE